MQKLLKVFSVALVLGMVCVSVLSSAAEAEKVLRIPYPGRSENC